MLEALLTIPKPIQELVYDKASALGLISSKQVIFKDITDADEIKNADARKIENRFLNRFGYISKSKSQNDFNGLFPE